MSIKTKIRSLIEAANAKTGKGDADLTTAVQSLVSESGGITPSGNKAITATTSTQTGIDVTNYATVSVAPTPSEAIVVTTNGDATPSSGKLLSKVTVNVPSGEARDASDLTVSGATVNVPAGLYSSAASKSVASGTAGTPTASKGAVSNNSVTVTPSVANTTGYITGGTKTGTGVTVSASELVSGNKAITPSETAQSGIDVTNFKTVSVDAISSTYVGSGVTKKAAATVAPSTSEQTVCASGVYTTGEQKVSAITPSIVGNLDASNFAASIVAAVEGKGVTVPSGTLLDGMASLIESIEAGGGGGAVTTEDKTYSVSNQAIEEFVENVNYTADYSTSSVGTYTAKPYADGGSPKGANVNIKGGTLHQLDNGNEYTKTVAEGATTIYNNTPDTVGAYSVVNDGNVVSYGKLTPSGNVRIIKCDGIVNMRDLGGWAADAGTVRYGKLFRSPAIDNATAADISMMSNLLGINSELDMRESGAEGGGSGRFENYLHQPMGNYADIIVTDAYKAKSKTAFEFVMNCAIQGKPCVFHCAAGADRTGTMAWVLLGVLGVSQSDCDKEYEITSFAGPTRLRSTYLGALYNAVNALDGDDFTNKCKNALISCGISIALINQFRHAMIDGNPVDLAEDTPFVPQEETVANLKACTRMKWSNSTVSEKAPTSNNGYLALAVTVGDTWQFTDRESNTCYGIKIPSWATKIVVSTTDASIIKWSFRSYLADGTAVGIADEDNTSGKYDVSNAEVIQISACYSTDGTVKPAWNYDSSQITVKFTNY